MPLESVQPVHVQRSVQAAGLFLAMLACSAMSHSVMAQGVPETGFKIMTSQAAGNCLACHALPNQSGVVSTFGPALGQVGSRYTAAELRQWVTDARQIKPGTLMPPFGTTEGTALPNPARPVLSTDEIVHVVAALQTLR